MANTDEYIIDFQSGDTFGISMQSGQNLNVEIDPRAPSSDNDYNTLRNKPQIEGNILIGNKTYEELNMHRLTNQELEQILTM